MAKTNVVSRQRKANVHRAARHARQRHPKYFSMGKRYRLTRGDFSASGSVARVLISGHGAEAWLTMDVDLPAELKSFNDLNRARHILAHVDECEELP